MALEEKGDGNRRNRLRLSPDGRSEKDVQAEGFRKQLRLAERINKPVVIHTREALKDTFDILADFLVLKGYCIVTRGHMFC